MPLPGDASDLLPDGSCVGGYRFTNFRGVVDIDPARLGGSAGAISQEVVQRLISIMRSNVRVTLEIEADVPDGIPEKVEHDVSENCQTLKFRKYEFGESG